ncbi:MAG: response regulator [Meiothermus silvanus]|nr:response regulator [Allomeiothermus silvanus]
MIRIVLADDHALFRQGLRSLLEAEPDFRVVGEAGDGREALRHVLEAKPDIVLMDIQMPGLDGVQATQEILREWPQAKVIMLTMYRQDAYVFEAVKAGKDVYLQKPASLTIAEGDDVHEDEVVAWVEDTVSGRSLPVRAPLSGRVTSVPVRKGENVLQGSVIATIHQTDRLEVILEVEETAIGQVAIGQMVELRFAALEHPVRATVTEIGAMPLPPEAGTTERERRIRKYEVKVQLADPDPRLRLGMAVRGRIFT